MKVHVEIDSKVERVLEITPENAGELGVHLNQLFGTNLNSSWKYWKVSQHDNDLSIREPLLGFTGLKNHDIICQRTDIDSSFDKVNHSLEAKQFDCVHKCGFCSLDIRSDLSQRDLGSRDHKLRSRRTSDESWKNGTVTKTWHAVRCTNCLKVFHKNCCYEKENVCSVAKHELTPFFVPHRFKESFKVFNDLCNKCFTKINDQKLECPDCGFMTHLECKNSVTSSCSYWILYGRTAGSLQSSSSETMIKFFSNGSNDKPLSSSTLSTRRAKSGREAWDDRNRRNAKIQLEKKISRSKSANGASTNPPESIGKLRNEKSAVDLISESTELFTPVDDELAEPHIEEDEFTDLGREFAALNKKLSVTQSLNRSISSDDIFRPENAFTWIGKHRIHLYNGHSFMLGFDMGLFANCAYCEKLILNYKFGVECFSCGMKLHQHSCAKASALCPKKNCIELYYEGSAIYHRPRRQLRRYLRLNNHQLSLFTSPEDSRVVKVFSMADIVSVQISQSADDVFEVMVASDRELKAHKFECPERIQWVAFLEKAIADHKQKSRASRGKIHKVHTQNFDLRTPKGAPVASTISSPMAHGEIISIDEDFKVDYNNHLGQGQFGTVVPGQNRKTNEPVAVKVILIKNLLKEHPDEAKKAKVLSNLKSEIKILFLIDHPCIIKLEGIYCTDAKVYIVTSRAHGDFLDIIHNSEHGIGEDKALFYMYQITTALVYMHSKQIAHRDLKPENILVATDDEYSLIKICDFGVTTIVGGDAFMMSICGTPAYAAPEVLHPDMHYGFKIDLWSLGIIAYVSMTCLLPEIPLNTANPEDVSFANPAFDNISNEAKAWISKCLARDPTSRFSAKEALTNGWFQNKPQLNMALRNLEKKFGLKGTFDTEQTLTSTRSFSSMRREKDFATK